MADVETARLCVQVIHSHFGPLTAAVAQVLLTRGRLALVQIVRFTQLKPRIVRAVILILVQHNLLWHDRTEEDGEVVEVNVDECLMRLRYGKFAWQAEQLFGKTGAEIVRLVLDHGKLRPPDIISQLSLSDPKESSAYAQALHKLVTEHYLKPSTILSHVSPTDRRIRYEAEEMAKILGLPTAKQIREAKEMALARLKRDEEEAEVTGIKKVAKDQPAQRLGKRKVVDEEQVNGEVHFRVNFDKFNVHTRNVLIEIAARERFNESTAVVMRAILKTTEFKQRDISEVRSEPTSISSIATQIPSDEDLGRGLVPTTSKTASPTSYIKEYLALLAMSDNPTLAGRAASFISLSSSKVYVEFETLCRRLRRRVLEAVTRERHGDSGMRILRLLLDTGKMDERQISKVTMMAPKDVRPLLSALSADSLVCIQEVPKTADRNPTRTFYLWYVDLQKVYSVLLANFYKMLFNIAVRRRAEREDPVVKAVLEKKERSDVTRDESLLTRMERDVLNEWEKKSERLTILEARVGQAVFILRDLGAACVEGT